MEDIKVGELVRTKKGYIEKIKTVNHYGIVIKHNNDNDDFSEDINYYAESGLEINKMDIKKHSFNLIDLIEVGDYVNGKRVSALKGEVNLSDVNDEDDFCYTDFSDEYGEWYGIGEDEVQSILTHEQFEANAYKVKGE